MRLGGWGPILLTPSPRYFYKIDPDFAAVQRRMLDLGNPQDLPTQSYVEHFAQPEDHWWFYPPTCDAIASGLEALNLEMVRCPPCPSPAPPSSPARSPRQTLPGARH